MANYISTPGNKDILEKDFKYKVSNLVQNMCVTRTDTLFQSNKSNKTYASVGAQNVPASQVAEMNIASVGQEITANSIINAVKAKMELYRYMYKVTVKETWSGGTYKFVAKFSSARSGASFNSQINSLAAANNIANGQILDAVKINTFINGCQDMWLQANINSPKDIGSVSFCHTNHASHSSHGSRGRR